MLSAKADDGMVFSEPGLGCFARSHLDSFAVWYADIRIYLFKQLYKQCQVEVRPLGAAVGTTSILVTLAGLWSCFLLALQGHRVYSDVGK